VGAGKDNIPTGAGVRGQQVNDTLNESRSINRCPFEADRPAVVVKPARLVAHNTSGLLSFPSVGPEPVLANDRVSENLMQQRGVFLPAWPTLGQRSKAYPQHSGMHRQSTISHAAGSALGISANLPTQLHTRTR